MVKGYVDDRENFNISGINADIEKKRLEIGDLSFPEIDLVIENKWSWSDLFASIRDNRIYEQMIRMQEYKYKFIYVMDNYYDFIEEPTKKAFETINIKSEIAYGIHIIRVHNIEMYYYSVNKLIDALANGIDTSKDVLRSVGKLTSVEDRKISAICCAGNIGYDNAVILLEENSIKKLAEMDIKQLMKYKGIGYTRAENIYKLLNE
jgi:ERCC4-type nuclease